LPSTTEALPTEASRGRLLKILGVTFGLAVAIGNTIAAGIVRAPGEIAAWLPNVWLFLGVWVAGGLYALAGAAALSELGTMLPRSGGQYVYARHALGPYAGFIVGWSDWLSTCGTTATVAFVIGEYSEALFPALTGHTVAIASGVALGFALLQWRGLRWGSRTQEFTSLLKGLGFIALVVACFALGGAHRATASAGAAHPSVPLIFGIVLALQAVIYTYDGWSGCIYFSEEVRDPGRNIPRAMFGGVLSILGIYLLLNAALVYILPISRIAGEPFALGLAAQALFGAYGDTTIRSLMVVSMLSGINAYHLMATRVLFAMSRDGLLSRYAARVNPGGTPSVALFASAFVAVLFIVLSGAFRKLIAVMSFFFVANYTVSFLAVFILRRREPDAPRPYRTWGHPWTTGFALAGSVAFLIGAIWNDLATGTRDSIYTLLVLAASYPIYRISRSLAGTTSS
jgi:APA family basic amino acid/polyamine antiporter